MAFDTEGWRETYRRLDAEPGMSHDPDHSPSDGPFDDTAYLNEREAYEEEEDITPPDPDNNPFFKDSGSGETGFRYMGAGYSPGRDQMRQ